MIKIVIISMLSVTLTGCGIYTYDRSDRALLDKHAECKGDHDTVRNAKFLFFGMSDEKQMACAREKEAFDKSPAGLALAESERKEIERKENEYRQLKSTADSQCKVAGAHLAGIKGANLNGFESTSFDDNNISCRVVLSIGFDARYYDIDLDRRTRDYNYYALPQVY